mmetsp:Transcript_15811/g.31487  ORF Transcript_15811/g.31487 Transcript_15811/m.31487 type:complete len:95 (+) Transcript_15811:290-574(+)
MEGWERMGQDRQVSRGSGGGPAAMTSSLIHPPTPLPLYSAKPSPFCAVSCPVRIPVNSSVDLLSHGETLPRENQFPPSRADFEPSATKQGVSRL